MIVYSYAAHFHKVKEVWLWRFPLHIPNNVGVRLYVSNQLLLLFQNILEVLEVRLRLILVHKLFDQLLLRQLSETVEVLPQFFLPKNSLDSFWEDSYCSDRW